MENAEIAFSKMNKGMYWLPSLVLLWVALGCRSADQPYTIISVTKQPEGKCSVDVRLPTEVGKDQLEQYARSIREEYCPSSQRVFIAYWLPEMSVGTGAWATTHFDPNLEVRIAGLTRDTKAKLVADEPIKGEIVGKWRDGTVGAVIFIVRNGTDYTEQTSFSDGSKLSRRLAVKSGNRFIDLESDSGDFVKIDAKGDLELHDNDGYIRTAGKLK